jgi:hypothetical protein
VSFVPGPARWRPLRPVSDPKLSLGEQPTALRLSPAGPGHRTA